MDKQLGSCLASLRDAAESARTGDYVDLAPYVSDLADICNDLLADEHISFAIAAIFDDETGLFSVVETLMPLRDRAAVKARELCWSFVANFIKKIGTRVIPYGPILKERCLKYFRRDEAKAVQAAALTPLIVLLESNMAAQSSKPVSFGVDWALASMLMVEFRKAKTNGTLRARIIQLLGYLVECFKAAFDEDNVATILKLCLDTLEEQHHQPLLVLMAGAIKCLDSVLTWFDDSLPAGGSVENSRRIYTYIEQVLWPREDLKLYEGLKACLRLLSRHAGLFSMRLLEDGLRNLHWLQDYCTHTNAAVRDAALPAYDQFLTQISSSLVSDNRIKNAQHVYKGFVRDSLEVLDAQGADPKRVSLAIRAIGKLAAPIVKFSGKDSLKEAFHRLEPFGASSRAGEGRDESLGHAVTLVGAFADIVIHLDSVEDFMVFFIAQVTGNIFYQFPQLYPKQKQAVYTTLRSLLKALYSKGSIFSLFLNNIVWSSLERAMEPVDEAADEGPTQLWRHYVELWSHLLEYPSDQGHLAAAGSDDGEAPVELVASDVGDVGINAAKLRESVFDAIMQCVIKAMTELNLKYRVKVASASMNPEEGDGGPNEPEAEMDIIEPLDLSQMRKYLNLVEFVQELLSNSYSKLFQKWTYPFGRTVIELSSRYPLISGFYKLLAVTITSADHEGFFASSEAAAPESLPGTEESSKESYDNASTSATGGGGVAAVSEEDRRLCRELFSKYLQEVLVASRRYKLELLAACLRLCLSAPPALMGIASVVPPMRNALKIGLRYLPLAAVAMDALERWQAASPEELEHWLPHIVPCLNDYLVDVENTELSESETVTDSTGGAGTSAPSAATISRAQLARIKQARAKEAQPGPFELIQVRVQKFLGRIGGFAHLLVSDVDLLQVAGTGGLAWDPVDRIKFTLPFREEKPDIWLDPMLSRIVELALSSSDRRMKVTASELLHGVCLLMLGSAAKGPMRRRGEESQSAHFDKLYKRLFPAVLRLATDVELVTRQLFLEFSKQLIHWLTSNQQKENPETMALLDAILDGLVDPENGSLREFCADCFAEFMRWSVRHAPPEADNFVNVTSMLRRVYNRMDHPNPYHRLGVAMAAHRMYPVLRENGAIVDRHIFEILFFCIKSLRLGESDDEQIGTTKQMNKTVDLLQRLITRNMASLQKKRKDRPLFLAFEDFLFWLFEQTGRIQEKCRTKCIKLFSSVCQSIPGSAASWFRARIGPEGNLREALKQFDVGMEYPVSERPSLQQEQLWLAHFTRSLHWFEWALREKLITAAEMLECVEDRTLGVVATISSFLHGLLDVQDPRLKFGDLTPGEQERLHGLQCNAMTHLLNLYLQAMNAQTGAAVTGGDAGAAELFAVLAPAHNTSFQKLLCLVLLRPRRLGFALAEPQRALELAQLAMRVLKRVTEVSPAAKAAMVEALKAIVDGGDPAYDLGALSFALAATEPGRRGAALRLEDAMSLVKGYQQLNQAGILHLVMGKPRAAETGERLLLAISGVEQAFPPAVAPVAVEALGLAMVLGVKVGRLLDLVLDSQPVASPAASDRKLTKGEVFYMNFRRTVVLQVKFFYRECLGRLLAGAAAAESPTARMLLTALLDEYLRPGGAGGESITKGSFVQELLRHIRALRPCCVPAAPLTEKQFFLEVLQKLLMLDATGKGAAVLASDGFIVEAFLSFIECSPDDGANGAPSGKSAMVALKSAAIALIPHFFSAGLGAELRARLGRAVTGIVTEHLLVREADLPRGSVQRASYAKLLAQLLNVAAVSRSLELLETLFPLLQSPTRLAARGVTEAVEAFATSATTDDEREAAFNLCLGVVTDGRKSAALRRAVVETVFEPLVNAAPAAFVAAWYAARVADFFRVLQLRPSLADAERERDDLTSKICHYGLVELLFLRLDSRLVKETINPVVKNMDLLKQAGDESHSKLDPGFKPFPENAPLWRELHCAAYNCLAALIMCTQEQENFFNIFLLKETAKSSLWQHLMDLDKVYDNLPVETSQLGLASETVRALRADRKVARRSWRAGGGVGSAGTAATLSSQYMVGASLSQEPAVIASFVGGGPAQGPAPPASLGAGLLLDEEGAASADADADGGEQGPTAEDVVETAALDRDDFDQHPCMDVVLRLIEHLHSKFGDALHGSPEMPDWMKSLHAILENGGTHVNVRLFLAKVVTKARKIFAPYAAQWFRPYVLAVLADPARSGGLSFHYLLRDICVTVLQWNLPAAPDSRLATRLVQHLVGVAAHGSTQVLRANVDIVRLFLESWREGVRLERGPLLQYLIAGGKTPDMGDKAVRTQRAVGLQLLGAVAAAGLPLADPVADPSASEAHLCEALLNNLGVKTKEVYEAAAELIGIASKQRREAAAAAAARVDEELLEARLHRMLKQLYRDAEYKRFFNILNKATARDPALLRSGGYAAMVADQLPRLFGVYRANAIDTLRRCPDAEPHLFVQLARALPKLLGHRDEVAQLKMLQLLAALVKDVAAERIAEAVLPILCNTFGGHENSDCRREYYNILMYLFKSKGMDEDRLVVRSLLLGLCDASDAVRASLQQFWHSQLSQDVRQRFAQLINQIYDPTLEEHWAQISNVLLLKLCEDSVDYNRPIFTAPLSACEFHDYTINTSWMGGSLPMTPLFSSSQMQTAGSQAATQGGDGEGEGEVGGTQRRPPGGMVRATMTPSLSLAYSQTQGGGTASFTQGSALFAMSQRPSIGATGYAQAAGRDGGGTDSATANLRRRILSPRVAHSQVVSRVLHANRRREACAAVQALERANKVHMMRHYRTGELPDIEIKHAEILGPLAALADRDAAFGRLLLTTLCGAVYALPQAAAAGPADVKAEVRRGLEAALRRTRSGISFVGCAQALCLQDPEIWLPPALVGAASRKSTNYHAGALLLEQEILLETPPEPPPPEVAGGKRQKGRGGQVNRPPRPLEEAWLELAQVYKALGEDDIVLGLFQTRVAQHEATHRALEAQLGGDLQRAVVQYDKAIAMYEDSALSGDIPKAEIDIWYNQRLACLADLNKWGVILQDTVFEITGDDDADDEPDFKRLWAPERQEPYLGLFVRGALKVPAYRGPLAEFVQSALDDPPKRRVLLDDFGTQLATLAAANGEWDRARFHVGHCYRVFRRRWSALHPLALGARHLHVRQLQKTVELDEFVNFITDARPKELPSLLGGWRKRWPSPELDDVEAWDDITQNRLMFFNHIQAHFNQSNPGRGGGGAAVAAELNAERAHLYFQAATGLMKRGALTVAQSYMTDYMASQSGFADKERLDFEFLKALVRIQCLQAERAESASARVEMLQQLLKYLHGEEKKAMNNPTFRQEFYMVEGDVAAQVAWATLATLPDGGARSAHVSDCFALLGSAFTAYSTALAPSDDKTTTNGSFSSRDAAKASLKFGLFCDELLKLPQSTTWGVDVRERAERGHSATGLPPASALPELVVRHMLQALALDSAMQVQHAVARLLSLAGRSPATRREFAARVGDVPSSVFIAWIPQMLASVEDDVGPALVDVLESIARQYPQALYIPFRVSETDFGPTGRERTQALRALLGNPRLESLVRALEDLTYPEQRLRDGLSQIMSLLFAGDRVGARALFREVYRDCLDTQALRSPERQAGEWNLKFARDWAPRIVKELGEDGSKLQSMDAKRFAAAVSSVAEQLARSNTPAGRSSLGTLSKWLADFDQSKGLDDSGAPRVEIPGQYNGGGGNTPHVELVGFDQTLVCLKSKQRPKILTMRGSDEKEYKFVVKGGEDLRLDQRIEQLFEVMNGVLCGDAACARRRLAVRTYAVVPVSKKCGLLQFVEDTCVLEDIIKDGLSSKLAGQKPLTTTEAAMNDVRAQYMEWVHRRGGGAKNPNENYCNLYRRVGYDEVAQKLSSLQAQLPWDALRTGFARLATSAESYLALRSHFARSLAVTSICGYVAGVGDRHLANTLVDMRSGALVPIDFGYSFGTNVLLLPVPELVPFRLTAQLTNFLRPLDAVGLLRSDMVRAMAALHASRDVISAVMEVFVNEPLVDWKQEAVKLRRARGGAAAATALDKAGESDPEAASPEQQHVELKVENAQLKLELWNPAEITVAELRSSVHANKPYTAALEAIVRGDTRRNVRAGVGGAVCASVQEQVDCLLDQATDPNLLGRIFAGWQPWV